jgi:DNA-binding NarL/FixJ family response regulator
VIVHSSHSEPEIMAAAFEAGASGYLIKGSSQSLVSSIRTVVRHVWKGETSLTDGPPPYRRSSGRTPAQSSL